MCATITNREISDVCTVLVLSVGICCRSGPATTVQIPLSIGYAMQAADCRLIKFTMIQRQKQLSLKRLGC